MPARKPVADSAMSLQHLVQSTDADYSDVLVTGLALDSRKVRPGDLFLAMPGDVHDGRQFIEQAVANGACAVLAEAPAWGFVESVPVPLVEMPELRFEAGELAARFYGDPSRALHTVGVTGTNGKTTTTRLLGQLQRALGRPCGVIGTLGASLDDSVVEAGNTTPDPVAIQRQLAQWRDEGVATVGMEVSSHALVQGRVGGVTFESAIFTNLTHDHLDYHGSMAAYARAKMRLFATEGLRNAIINIDDELAPLFAAAAGESAEVLTYSGSGAGADIRVVGAQFYAGGISAEIITPWGRGMFNSPLTGAFNVSNLAAAIAALVLAGESLDDVLAAVSGLRPVAGRMQPVPNARSLQVVIDYAHTPDALEQALVALRPHVRGRLVTVFGCGGDRDRDKRQLMGRAACRLSDRVLVTSDNPRSEDPLSILHDIEVGCSGDYVLEADRAHAIAMAIAQSKEGDCVLIAGKGHENYQLVEGERLPFSDEAQARRALTGSAVE